MTTLRERARDFGRALGAFAQGFIHGGGNGVASEQRSYTAKERFFKSLRLRMKDTEVTEPYRQHAWVYACIRSIAANISGVPFRLYTGPQETPHEVDERGAQSVIANLATLFANPNPLFARHQLWEATFIYLELRGEAFWMLPRNNAQTVPREIWLLEALVCDVRHQRTLFRPPPAAMAQVAS